MSCEYIPFFVRFQHKYQTKMYKIDFYLRLREKSAAYSLICEIRLGISIFQTLVSCSNNFSINNRIIGKNIKCSTENSKSTFLYPDRKD